MVALSKSSIIFRRLKNLVKVAHYSKDTCGRTNTVELWLNHWKSVFVESDISEPDESARHIMSAALSCSWADLDRLADTALSPDQLSDLERRCRCRLQRMPVQYIVGDWEFCDVTLTLRPPVFIPRPETEQLARLAADRLRRRADPAPRLLEVGCGSGAISVAALHWLKQVVLVADRCQHWRWISRRRRVS